MVFQQFYCTIEFFKRIVAQKENEILESIYEAKKTISALGLEYVKIHACPNDCILYIKEYKGLFECPTCLSR